MLFVFFQAEDGIRDLVRSRGSEMCIRDSIMDFMIMMPLGPQLRDIFGISPAQFGLLVSAYTCLLYTSDAADERSSVDLGGRRIIKKKK